MSEGKSKGFSLPIVLLIVVLMIVLAAGTSFLMVFIFGNNSGDAGTAQGTNKQEEPVVRDLGPTYDMGEFIVNLTGGRTFRYIKSQIVLEAEDKKVLAELEERHPQLRDAILTILRDTNADELEDGDLTDLKNQIVDKVNDYLTEGDVKSVFFNVFVIQ